MTRDHYKGSRKVRDAVLNSKGELLPISKNNTDEVYEHFKGAAWRIPGTQQQVPIYVRNNGDDALDGSSELQAVATLARGFELFSRDSPTMVRQYLELTGYTTTLGSTRFQTPWGGQEGDNDFSREGVNDNGKSDWYNWPTEMYADPELVLSITITGFVEDSITGLQTVQVSDTLVPDAHVGQFLNTGIAQLGVIHSNTTSEIICSTDWLSTTGPTGIYKQSCVITSTGSLNIDFLNKTTLNGIYFKSTSGSFYFSPHSNLNAVQCRFERTTIQAEGSPIFTSSGCYFDDFLTIEGMAHAMNACTFKDVTWTTHGSGGHGKNTLTNCILDGCTAYGASNFESAMDIEINNCLIDNGTSHGIQKSSPFQAKVVNSTIQNCAGSAIYVSCGGGVVNVQNVSGAGNTGYGLILANGAQADAISSPTVSGTLGQVKVGDSAVSLWSDPERTDVGETNPQFCRIF